MSDDLEPRIAALRRSAVFGGLDESFLAHLAQSMAEVTFPAGHVLIEPRAAALLAERIGGAVWESDIERGQQTRVADGELRKLATYAGAGAITSADVEALVADVDLSDVSARTDDELDEIVAMFASAAVPVTAAVEGRELDLPGRPKALDPIDAPAAV